MRRVGPADVEGGIGLGIAQRLGFGERLGEVGAGRLHRGQDEIAGAVEDARDPADRVRRRPFAKPRDHRHRPGHRRLKAERDARRLGPAGQRRAVMRDHCLVGGDQRLARIESRFGQRQRRSVGTADQLDHAIDIRAAGER